jgi:Uma2 family endonuclease
MSLSLRQSQAVTASEFERLVRADLGELRVELRDGRITKLSPQHAPHAWAKKLIERALDQALETAGLPWLVLTEVSAALTDDFQPLPDVVVVEASDARPVEGPIPGDAVRLVVEVADRSLGDDLGPKLTSYARANVAEYWVVDLGKDRLLLHAEPDGDTYARREPRAFGERFAALTLPLSVDTSALAPGS